MDPRERGVSSRPTYSATNVTLALASPEAHPHSPTRSRTSSSGLRWRSQATPSQRQSFHTSSLLAALIIQNSPHLSPPRFPRRLRPVGHPHSPPCLSGSGVERSESASDSDSSSGGSSSSQMSDVRARDLDPVLSVTVPPFLLLSRRGRSSLGAFISRLRAGQCLDCSPFSSLSPKEVRHSPHGSGPRGRRPQSDRGSGFARHHGPESKASVTGDPRNRFA
jgi:hypothetical protein